MPRAAPLPIVGVYGGETVRFEYLTGDNIQRSTSLFDLLVLTWWEIKVHEGEIRTALEVAEEDDNVSAAAEVLVDEAVSWAWSADARLAGNREIDSGVRTALI